MNVLQLGEVYPSSKLFCAVRGNTTDFDMLATGHGVACILFDLFFLNTGRYAFLKVAFLPPPRDVEYALSGTD